MTSATNGTLIYTTSPVIIIVIEALVFSAAASDGGRLQVR